jgi:glutamate---cysteine ligase / carboxylate-amine ligase
MARGVGRVTAAMQPDFSTSHILAGVEARFDESTDFTVGLEEEFQILDPVTLGLVNRYEELVARSAPDFRAHLAGELIASEIEFKTGAHADLDGAARELAYGRIRMIETAGQLGCAIGISGVHPYSVWGDQRIIDTPHYRIVEGELGYIAWTNNTFAIHMHCGIRGADRAVHVATRMRSLLPELLAVSANSPIFMGTDTNLASTRTQTFIKSFPRCGIPDAYDDWNAYASHVALLERVGSIRESTQIWWTVRPHHSFGTLEVRICDGQTEFGDGIALAALTLAAIADLCAQYDDGVRIDHHPRALIEENIWRAQRHGLDGELIDLDRGQARPTRTAVAALIERTAHVHDALGITRWIDRIRDILAHENGAMQQRRVFAESGHDLRALQAHIVDRTGESAREVIRDYFGGTA